MRIDYSIVWYVVRTGIHEFLEVFWASPHDESASDFEADFFYELIPENNFTRVF